MNKRKCAYCSGEINLPHIRTWEEGIQVSRMLVFCNIVCMIKYYNYGDVHPQKRKKILGE